MSGILGRLRFWERWRLTTVESCSRCGKEKCGTTERTEVTVVCCQGWKTLLQSCPVTVRVSRVWEFTVKSETSRTTEQKQRI
jgi:hypothetical protein